MEKRLTRSCPDCQEMTRRDFVRTVGTAALVTASPVLVPRHGLYAAPTKESAAETAVGRLYSSLSDEQKKTICLPFNDEKRLNISANWHVTKPTIGDDFFSNEQRELIDQIVRGVSSEDGYKRFVKQMEEDDGGMNFYSIAIFGEPGSGGFEWEMTGRHLTLRADGDSVAGAAFGGPIVYGHGEEDPASNLFHYQTRKANEVFAALDPKQRDQALLDKAPRENAVQLQDKGGAFPGIAVSDLSADQRKLVRAVIKDLLAPYREEDVEEAMSMLKEGGGMKTLHMAFYKEGDLKSDQVWDIWRIEGPTFVSHFRGAPHVHAYLNIGKKA